MQSAPHPSMARLLDECESKFPINYGQRFTLVTEINTDQSMELYLVGTTGIDCQTAATHALIYAFWQGDDELVKLIIQDLQELIDVDIILMDNWGARVYKAAIDMFGSQVDSGWANHIFSMLCQEYSYGKDRPDNDEYIRIALDAWADQLDPYTVKECLINQWENSLQKQRVGIGESHGLIAQLIVERCLKKIEGEGIRIALAVCCFPANTNLFDTVFDLNQEQINDSPSLLRHTLLELCSLDDTDTFGHILSKCGGLIYLTALLLWCEAGNLEAVRMILGSITYNNWPVRYVRRTIVSASKQGDAELVEILVNFFGNSVDEKTCREAWRRACYFGHEDVVRSLSVLCPHHLDFRYNTDLDTELDYCSPDIISLLNTIYGTTLDPAASCRKDGLFEARFEDDQYLIEYDFCLVAIYESPSFECSV